MIIISSKNFEKSLKKINPKIQLVLGAKLRIFMNDPWNFTLNNHTLHGSMRNYRSINITGDYRAIYEEYDKNTVRLIDIDTHSGLYGK
ncbi:MAG: type II toxin-antitoxin system mRNA interferase toxin, RelE/StbE family [bacterium]|nr:type II toxin-antitoxin system mRNA interferase toxin, RelE/StbE family [bacterium]